jgi:protein-disulfide isomerase
MILYRSITAILSSFLCLAFAESPKTPPSDDTVVLVEIDGTPISAAEFKRKKPQALFQARYALYDAQRKALDAFVDDYLLERQARKENVTTAELLKRHVEDVIEKDPSEEVLKVYYEGVDSNEPFETAKDKIREYIRQRRIAKARAAYMQSLRSEAKIAIRLEPPRTEISLKNTPIRGAAGAPVTVIEFADFECPYCQVVHPELAKLRGDFGDKLAFAFKDLPLPNHTNAQKAAEAAHCAGAQGKYWEYHDLLFEKKQSAIANLKEYARGLNLNGEAFDKCLDSGAQAARVKADLVEAQELSIPGTPAFFVNGRFLSGPVRYEVLRNAINEELGRSSAPTTGMLRSGKNATKQ